MEITGVMVQYFISCKRELWFFANKINLNCFDQNINIGKKIHEESYKREKTRINLDDTISIDFISKAGKGFVFEIKKSSKLIKPAKYQLLYYLWYLKKKKGVLKEGFLTYPNEKKREKIILTKEKEVEIEGIIKKIKEIIKLESPPKAIKKPYCKNCSYYELCWV